MVYEYYEHSNNDIDFVRQLLATLDREMRFWAINRTVDITLDTQRYTVYRYCTRTNTPRPESYIVDMQNAANVSDRPRFWQNVASAAESGWDFSTRWFTDHRRMQAIDTCDILPVDLNAFVCWNAAILEYLHARAGIIALDLHIFDLRKSHQINGISTPTRGNARHAQCHLL